MNYVQYSINKKTSAVDTAEVGERVDLCPWKGFDFRF